MGYTLHGFIAKSGTFGKFRQPEARVSVVELNQGFDLLLNDVYLGQLLEASGYGDADSQDSEWLLGDILIEMTTELSNETAIAYINADFFGGSGYQQAIVWENGQQILKSETKISSIPKSFGPINEALRILGVKRDDQLDEFQAVGLSRYRQMERWFEEATGMDFRDYLNQ